jgi:ABC-type transport system involved in multi-copper enzyme maturation permease subunit
MLAAFRSEVRKVLSLRSTYIILAFSLAMELLFAFYLTGWHTTPEALMSGNFLSSQVVSAVNALGLFAAIVAILLVTHEYRYNTIVYTLTANKSRTQVLLAKFLTVSVFAILFTALFGLLSPLLSLLAIHIRGLELGSQDIHLWSLAWRTLLAGWGYIVLAFILAVIIRIQVGAIVALFLIPATVEQLLGLVLKQNQVYLPFSSLNILLDVQAQGNHISYARAGSVLVAYIIIGLLISWLLFTKRDAN